MDEAKTNPDLLRNTFSPDRDLFNILSLQIRILPTSHQFRDPFFAICLIRKECIDTVTQVTIIEIPNFSSFISLFQPDFQIVSVLFHFSHLVI